MAVNVFTAKRALIDLLQAETGTGGLLENRQVLYAFQGRDVERVCVYGGGVRFGSEDTAAEDGTVQFERLTLGLYVRVVQMDSDIRAADVEAETVANAVCAVVAATPDFAGGYSSANVVSGQGDYGPNADGVVVVLSLQVRVESFVDG